MTNSKGVKHTDINKDDINLKPLYNKEDKTKPH